MGTWRPLTRVLGRTRQLPAGDVLNGVYPPYTPVYKSTGALITVYRRDGVEQGVAPHIPAYQANGAELRVATDSNFAITVTQVAGTTRLVNAGVAGVTRKIPVQFANLAAFPAIGSSERLYVAADTRFEYLWSGNGYVLASSVPNTLGTTDDLPEGTTNLYFSAARVLSTVLAGLSSATNSAITAADSLIVALGKLQAQLNNKLGVADNAVSATKLLTARSINTVPFDGTADIAVSNILPGVEAGYGTNNAGSNNWAANIWGMGPAYRGSGLNTSYTPGDVYGLVWVRTSHANADAAIGEGLYIYQAGNLKGGIGSLGIKTSGTFAGDGSSITGLNASNLSAGVVPSGRLSGTYAINITGNAGTATSATSATTASSATTATTATQANKLTTARTINGVAFDGTANITIPSSGGGVFTASFISADIALTLSTYTSVSHGLGTTPTLFFGRIKCVIAEKGYSVGDIVNFDAYLPDMDGGGTTITRRRGYVIGATSTTVFAQIGNTDIIINDKNGGTSYGAITTANWRLVIYAYA